MARKERQLRLAVIGCGDHGRGGHLTAYRQLAQEGEPVRIIAVCDQHPGRARAAAEEFGVFDWYTDHRSLLDRLKPDAVSIATPPVVHCRQALDALGAGAHVLCEKPLAMNAAEAEAMVAGATRARRVLSMGLQSRHQPAARYLRALFTGDRSGLPAAQQDVALPDLGAVYHTRVWAGHVLRLPPSRHFFNPDVAGGGVIAATAVHILDAVLWMLGNPAVATVSATTFARTPRMPAPPAPFETPDEARRDFRVEDFAFGLVRFADGSTMTIESSWLMHPTSRATGAEFLTTAGVAGYGPLSVRLDDGKTAQDVTPGPDVVPERKSHYFLEVARDFVRAAVTGAAPVVQPAQMLQVQRLIDALYESARAGRELAVG